jgi:regulator of ribonuclease activity A
MAISTPAPFATADLSDAHADRSQSCHTQFTQYGGRKIFSGKIQTVECLNDNVLVRSAIEKRASGDVLVVDGGAYLGGALVGDMIASLAMQNGWAGMIVYGAVRDINALAALDFGVKALGTNPRRSAKNGAGRANVPVSFGGVTFVPGHWIYCDDDGILVSAEKLEIA